jgi:predicted nucleic acid-binding Zn finger protein
MLLTAKIAKLEKRLNEIDYLFNSGYCNVPYVKEVALGLSKKNYAIWLDKAYSEAKIKFFDLFNEEVEIKDQLHKLRKKQKLLTIKRVQK